MKNSTPPSSPPFFFTCFAFLLFSSSNLLGQNNQLKFEILTTEDGLSSNVIYNVHQDSKGYLWIATNEGINRYDGYEFKAYRHIPGNTATIPENQVYFVYEDSEGTIWAGSDGGLAKYNSAKNNFERIEPPGKNLSFGVNQVLQSAKDEMMVLTGGEVFLLNVHTLATKELVDSNTTNRVSYKPVNLAKDKNGNIYLSLRHWGFPQDINSIFKYNIEKKIFLPFLELPFLNRSAEQFELASYLFIDSRNTFWIGTGVLNRIYKCSLDTSINNSLRPVLIKKNIEVIINIFEDRDGKIWFAGSKGVLKYDYETAAITSITDQSASEIYQDKTGVTWIGSFNGLYKLNNTQAKFRHLSSQTGSKPQLLSDFVLGIREIAGKKILVTYHWGEKRFSLFNPISQTLHHLSRDDFSFEDFIKKINVKNFENLNKDSLNKVLPVTKYFFRSKKHFTTELYLVADNKQSLWFVNGQEFSITDSMDYQAIFSPDLSDVQLYKDEFWLTTNGNGLWSINTSTYKTKKYYTAADGKNSVSSNHLNCLLMEKNGNIWIGTKGTGLDYFDRSKKTFRNYTIQDGLSNNSVFCLVFDDKGRLWIGTGNGLSNFDTTTKIFTNFHRSDGLSNSEFNRFSACKLPDGYLMMGGMNGIDYFHPDSVMSAFLKPQVQITDFKVYNKSILPAENISLTHNNNYVTIEFAAMDFRKPGANQYAYMLNGIDKEWVLAGNLRSVSYATLSPGSYHFLVKAAGSDGIWNEVPAEIHFTISGPWWRNWWFFTMAIVLVSAGLFSIYIFRIQQLKKVFAVRTKISQDLHDEVGATLTSISFLSEVVKQKTGNEEPETNEAVNKIGQYSREMIGEMNDIVWVINPANDKFEEIEDRMRNFASTILSARNIQLNFNSSADIKHIPLGMQQRKNLYLIFKEAVNNASKYAACTKLNVNISLEDHHIRMDVMDNGKGFISGNLEINGSGNGLNNMQARAAEVNGKIMIHSEPEKGTHISLSIPIGRNAY